MTLKEFSAKARLLADSINCAKFFVEVSIWCNEDTIRYEACFYDIPEKGKNLTGTGKSPDECLSDCLRRMNPPAPPQNDIALPD